ncbi:MAG: phosphatase PAP2 family protein [Roseburia sp.]|nr:phosphatase PAP2 family protein [Roseburia sp.]
MKREAYERMTEYIKKDPKKVRLINRLNQILTGIVFCAYPLFLLILFLEKDAFLIRAVVVPAVSFGAVTLFRYLLNVPRPYEKFGLEPVLEKDTRGKSFPSRHVFSVYMIAATVFVCYPGVGILLGVLGLFLAGIRVAGGVHEPRDVAAGAVIGILCAVAGYYFIPIA